MINSHSVRTLTFLSHKKKIVGIKILLGAFFLTFWHVTQYLLHQIKCDHTKAHLQIIDRSMEYLETVNRFLLTHENIADLVLILSSAYVDIVIICFFIAAILGTSTRPFWSIVIFLLLRQTAQALIYFPIPENMIWHYPGFPSLIVSYYTTTDFFFSGHVGTAVLETLEICERKVSKLIKMLSVILAVFMVLTVLSLRIHYVSDVIASSLAAFLSFTIAKHISAREEILYEKLSRP